MWVPPLERGRLSDHLNYNYILMKRRDFVFTAGLGSMSFAIHPHAFLPKGISTAGDLNRFLRTIYIVKEPSLDHIIIGNPETKIRKVGTAWMPYFETLKQAVAQGINVMVVHESTFYEYWEPDPLTGGQLPPEKQKALEIFFAPYLDILEKKKKWIEDNELVIIRCHDVLDIVKDFGIPFALGQKLGFRNEDIIRSKNYYNVYRIEENSALNIAGIIASGLKDLNQPGVAFYGDPERRVSSVGLGSGCICDPRDYYELEPDLVIAVDDTIRTWIHTTYAEDSGHPLVVINHGTSEENGMRLLNLFLKKNFPEIEFIHMNQGCGYRWVSA